MVEKQQAKKQILDLQKYENKKILVEYQGGRLVVGVLKGFDQLGNLVLDETEEYLRGIQMYFILDESNEVTDQTKSLGLVVCRATAILLISPFEGYEEIENPFLTA